MELPDSLNNLFGNGSDPDPEQRASRLDGGQVVAEGQDQIMVDLPPDSDVDTSQIEAALAGNASSVNVRGEAGGDTTVTPVASGTDLHISDSAFDLSDWERKAHLDDRITNLMDRGVDYNQSTGQWMLANDDLIPGILIRLKSLMMGKDGMSVTPEDPDVEADQRLADHMDAIYSGQSDVEADVDPGKVLDSILEQNALNAVWVGRSTDLQYLDVDDLGYVKDGETGQEIYIQDATSYTTFEVGDDGEPTIEHEEKSEQTALKIGEEVMDVRLYRTPPLQAVADDVVNKNQLKHLQGRKAELASIGGVIIKVNPPAWLQEEDYDNHVRAEDDSFGDDSGRLLELVMAQQIEAALATLEDYQTATVMSIPENWETDTIELPEMDESMSDMIRDYNESISRRLLLPLDLIELKSGLELSRNTMMQMFLDQIGGWQGQITDMFDKFAQIQAEIHGLSGSVEHKLPSISSEDEAEIVKLMNQAGILGLSESEARDLANTLEGVDLDTDQTGSMPPEGGPSAEQREQQMQEFLDQQPSGQQPDEPQGEGGQEAAAGASDGSNSGNSNLAGGDGERIELPTTCRMCDERTRMQGSFYCPTCHPDIEEGEYDGQMAANIPGVDDPETGFKTLPKGWDRQSVLDAWTSLGGSFTSCKAGMVANGKSPRFADRFCAALKDEVLQTEEWRGGEATNTEAGSNSGDPNLAADESFSEGQEVETPSGQGVVVEVRTEDFDGPDGAVEASDDNPAYIVGVESGVEVYRGSDLEDGEIGADVGSPETDLAAAQAAAASDTEDPPGWITAARGDGRFSYPDSWEESDTPARLILLKAWAGMNGQFDCGGDCCHGTMVKNGMSDQAANRFCASMKDRVMGGWEGWRNGAASTSVQASHGFVGFETLREAASHVRSLVDKRIPEGHTTEVRKRSDTDAFAVIIRDRDGNFQGSMVVRESETDADRWVVTGGDQFLGGA